MSINPADNPSLVNCASHGTAKIKAEGGSIDLIKFKIDSLGAIQWIEEADAAFLQLNIGFSGNHSSGVSNFTVLDWGHGKTNLTSTLSDYVNQSIRLNSSTSKFTAYDSTGEYTISIDKPFKLTSNGPLSFIIDYSFGGLSYSIPWSSPPTINWAAFRQCGQLDRNAIGGTIELVNAYITGELDQKMDGTLTKIKIKHTGYKMSGTWPTNLRAVNILMSHNDFTGTPPQIIAEQTNYQIAGNGFTGALPEFKHNTVIQTVLANSMHDENNPEGRFFFGNGKTMLTYTIGNLSSCTALKHIKFGAGQYYRKFRNKITINGVPSFSTSKKIKIVTVNHCGLSKEEASNLLIGLNNVNNYNGQVNIQGNNGLNAAGIAAKDALVSRGWTVTT